MKWSRPARRRVQSGVTLVEVLVSVLIFSVGVLGMLSLHARAIQLAGDAQQRAEAVGLAEQLLARMLLADPATAASFAHRPDGTVRCAPTGAASSNAIVTDWLADVAATYPRASAAEQQVVVSGTPANEVTIRLCWRYAEGAAPHTLEVSNRIQWP